MEDRRVLVPVVLFLFPFALFAQEFSYSKSNIITSVAAVTISPSEITRDFKPNLVHLEMPLPGGNSYQSFLLRQKELIRTHSYRKTGGTVNLGDAETPLALDGFQGNPFDGSAPTDNHVAISNNGKLISVANSTIFFYDTEGDSLLQTVSLDAFFDTLGFASDKYDPRVIYDPKQDRFILLCLNGKSDSTSKIVVAFSTSNNPMDEWNLYALSGNPLNDTSWSDYPIAAITDDELFITVNLLYNDTINTNESWKFLFRQSLLWQITKQRGYSGLPMELRFYDDIAFGNRPVRNLCPIQGGSTTYGPNIFILSNRNFDVENDTFFVLELTGTINDLDTRLEINVRKADIPYGLAPDAKQKSNRTLQTNDSRVLAGYYENNQIHFVQNSVNPDTVRSAIYHGIISDVSSTKTIKGAIIGIDALDFGYPCIAYTGKFPGDDEALISFDHTSQDTFAGFSAVFYDVIAGYSERVTLKAGNDFVLPFPGLRQRWGDYSGSQRKYDEPGKVWAAGFFGDRIGVNRVNATWISEIASPDTTSEPPLSAASLKPFQPKAFPNPVADIFSVDFELANDQFLNISLFDASGRLVKAFIRDLVKRGGNRFSFSIAPLGSGMYFLQISNGGEVIMTEKILKN